jgi:hypothetical protein
MRHESRFLKEGSYGKKVRKTCLAEPAVRRATRASLEAWGGTALVVFASVMMKVSSYSAVRTVVFVAAILVATGLIVRSLAGTGGNEDEE